MSFTLLKSKRKVCLGFNDLQEGQLITRKQYFSLYNEMSGSSRIWENPDIENNRYKVTISSYKTVNFYVEGVYPYLHEFISQENKRLRNIQNLNK